MTVQVNLQSASDALNVASMATLRGSQSLQTSVDTAQKMRENREWASEEQKKMRQSKVKAETAAANKSATVDDLYNKTIEQNPELFQGMITSGMESQMAEGWNKKGAAMSDIFYRNFGGAETPEEIRSAYINAAKTSPEILKGMPPLGAISQGDPEATAQFKMLQLSNYQDVRHRQALSAATHEGDIRSGQIDQQGAIESRQINQRGAVEAGLQNARFNFQAGESAKDRSQRASEFQKEFGLAGMKFAEDQYQFDEMMGFRQQELENSYKIAQIKAQSEGKALKVKDVLGESTTSFKTTTAPWLVKTVLGQYGVDGLGDSTINELAIELSNQVLADWDAAQAAGQQPAHPGEMMEDLIKYSVSSGRVKGGGWFPDTVNPVNPQDKADHDFLSQISPGYKDLSPEDQKNRRIALINQDAKAHEALMKKSKSYSSLSPTDQKKSRRALITQLEGTK